MSNRDRVLSFGAIGGMIFLLCRGLLPFLSGPAGTFVLLGFALLGGLSALVVFGLSFSKRYRPHPKCIKANAIWLGIVVAVGLAFYYFPRQSCVPGDSGERMFACQAGKAGWWSAPGHGTKA